MSILVEFLTHTFEQKRGLLVNSHWSDAFGCWILLVSTEDGSLCTVKSDAMGLVTMWAEDPPAVIVVNKKPDGSTDYED